MKMKMIITHTEDNRFSLYIDKKFVFSTTVTDKEKQLDVAKRKLWNRLTSDKDNIELHLYYKKHTDRLIGKKVYTDEIEPCDLCKSWEDYYFEYKLRHLFDK